ncbi:Putative integrase/recombinase y4rC (plasmid) [Cupriavidus necator]|jgi:site-specific recombinase XerD|uniref:site-specific integrase n=1 Tax=Cupriavidus necator TaxID=106590 RepID=UPI003F73B999
MTGTADFGPRLEAYFTKRLLQQRQASPHTVRSYRDSFRQLLSFAQQRLHIRASRLSVEDIDASFVVDFLDHIEKDQGVSIRTRNLRLTAIHSFFQYLSLECPERSGQIQRILAIPSKRYVRKQMSFLTHAEVDALLNAPDQATWSGRRDHAFILVAVQTGLRLSEMTGLRREDLVVSTGAHLRVTGKGRKERCTPLAKQTLAVLKTWLREPQRGDGNVVFPNAAGEQMSVHGVQYILNKHREVASRTCPSLLSKRISVHCLRHTMAMDLVQAGVDRSVIALWLGHESIETTQVYIEATLAMKEQALGKLSLPQSKLLRYHATDQLLQFLDSL